MKVENIVKLIGGSLIILIDMIYSSYGIINQICAKDDFCSPAIFIMVFFVIGLFLILDS